MQAAVPQGAQVAPESKQKSGKHQSTIRFPAYDLTSSVAVASAIYQKSGGSASKDHLAAHLGYKSPRNGAFLARVGSARTFGLLDGEGEYRITSLAEKILMPESSEQVTEALVEAFFNVPLFKTVYDEYRSKELPEGLGLKNALKNRFGVTPSRVDIAIRTLFASADTAGFFEARSGSRTQLIIPQVRKGSPAGRETPADPRANVGGGGGDGGDGTGAGTPGGVRDDPRQPVRTLEDLKAEYVETLIGVLRDQGKQGSVDPELMTRIEKLLSLG